MVSPVSLCHSRPTSSTSSIPPLEGRKGRFGTTVFLPRGVGHASPVRAFGGGRSAFSSRVTCNAAASATFSAPEPQPLPVGDVFPPPTQASFGNKLRAVVFYLVTALIAIPLFLLMLLIHPFVLLLDPIRRKGQHFINAIWANATTSLFYKTQIVGLENLPSPDSPAVYVANHQSYLDIFTLFQLNRPFKFISKTSNFLIPIIGWSMYLTGHVPIKRLDKRSQLECLKTCLELLQKGVPVLFFPEGTRSKDARLDSFKKGAFSIAVKASAPVVPITLLGTGPLMPSGMESTLANGKVVRVVIHPPITGSDADELCDKARAVIAETLVENGYGVN